MLDEFIEEQPIIYRVLKNATTKDKYSHAYLFELNGYDKGLEMALAFAKFLLCPHNYTNNQECANCRQCHNIDTGNFLEIKVISTDGQWIKKEQLEDLQQQFMKKSLIGNKKIYIINEAEKLNTYAANALLKFLEEPPEGIIAILLTNNMYQLLDTIVSRCQILSFKKNNKHFDSSIQTIGSYLFSDNTSYQQFISEDGKTYLTAVDEYISFLEKKKLDTIIYRNKSFLEQFNDRKKLSVAFELFVLYYKDVLNKMLGIECQYFKDFSSQLDEIVAINNVDSVSSKLKILTTLKANIKYNLNMNLLMDKLVILISEV